MRELMKNKYYNYESVQELALAIKDVYSLFQTDAFVRDIIDETWDSLELKARMRKITLNLGKHLPADYEQAIGIIDRVIAKFAADFNDSAQMYFPDFVEVYGQEQCNWDLSIAAIERYTPHSTAEFAVRPFIINNQQRMMVQMAVWAKHENAHVRRLASEGCRPALPWGQALESFKKDPMPVINILESLKNDSSLYVRKSVANNLNDISKTHPELVAEIAKAWYGKSKNTDWIIKHACRTLLKAGNKDVLGIFGFVDDDCVSVGKFGLGTAAVSIGEALDFSFTVSAKDTAKVRLEYAVGYVKSNGKRSRKIFQISEIQLKANQEKHYTKTHSFANLNTRKHYPGIHSITLIVNGAERGTHDFEVRNAK